MADFSSGQRKKLARQGKARRDGSFPIRNRQDLLNAIRAVGRASGGEAGRQAVRRYIIKRARALGLSNLIPDSWASDGTLKSSK